MRGRVATRKNHYKRCVFITFLMLSWTYVIVCSLMSNHDTQQEIYRMMKAKDLADGKVHNLIRGIYNKGGSKDKKSTPAIT